MSDLESIFGSEFDSSQFDPMGDYDLLKPGKYPVEIEEASVQPTKAGNGHYIKLKLRVIDGEYSNRVLFDNLNIDNPSQQAVEIAKRTLSAICGALNIGKIKDSAQLVGGKLLAHVKVKDGQNQVRTYSVLTSDAQAAQPPSL